MNLSLNTYENRLLLIHNRKIKLNDNIIKAKKKERAITRGMDRKDKK